MIIARKKNPRYRHIFFILRNLIVNKPEMIIPANSKAIPVSIGKTVYLCAHEGNAGKISGRKSLMISWCIPKAAMPMP